jgi:hypothetical protein
VSAEVHQVQRTSRSRHCEEVELTLFGNEYGYIADSIVIETHP